MEVVVQTGLKAVMVGGQLIVKLGYRKRFPCFFGGRVCRRRDKDGKERKGRRGIVVDIYSCQRNCVPAAEAEKG